MRDHTRRLSIFAGIGILNTLIDTACFGFFYEVLQFSILVSNVLAFLAAVTNSYVLNRRLTFSDRINNIDTSGSSVKFLAIAVFCLGVSTLIIYGLSVIMHPFFGKLIASAVSFVIGYLGSNLLVFPKTEREDSNLPWTFR